MVRGEWAMRIGDESGVQTSDSSSSNYWNLGVPDFVPVDRPLRAEYDVVVIGAGYSGLAVAWGLARHGRSVLVLEERSIGYGASSRNGGMVGRACRDQHEFHILQRRQQWRGDFAKA